MDLQLNGRRAIVCAASRGLGRGCAEALAAEGVNLVINARGGEALERVAAQLRRDHGVEVDAVAADITTESGREAVLARCPQPDILVNNAGGPPPGDFRDWNREDWIAAVEANMLTPIELIKATVDGMMERRFGRVVNITSSAVKAPISVLGLSNGARSGLTGFVAGIARETIRHNVTINNLLPGMFDTDRLRSNFEAVANKEGRSLEEVRESRRDAAPAGRFGDPMEFGRTCAFLCSAHAGYMTGQNVLIDGGAYPGTF
ncbi:MAG: SDR family oxidoreductase [Gammaproteobacteria bacterium]|nr:SDR family oxidoreductase [Gammaproteobacteria bacterium]